MTTLLQTIAAAACGADRGTQLVTDVIASWPDLRNPVPLGLEAEFGFSQTRHAKREYPDKSVSAQTAPRLWSKLDLEPGKRCSSAGRDTWGFTTRAPAARAPGRRRRLRSRARRARGPVIRIARSPEPDHLEAVRRERIGVARAAVTAGAKITFEGHDVVKPDLAAMQYDKCCYCEKREEQPKYRDVEHYRPKSV